MRFRCGFRRYPNGPRRGAPARASGGARVVYNDALRAREAARADGVALPRMGEPSPPAITAAKKTEECVWSGEVSAVARRRSPRDLEAVYRSFVDSLTGRRPRVGAPRFPSRKDRRPSVRFIADRPRGSSTRITRWPWKVRR